MTIIVSPMQPADLLEIQPQPMQADYQWGDDVSAMAVDVMRNGETWSLRDARDGRLLMIAGVRPVHDQCLWLWSIIAHDAGRMMLPMTRLIQQWMAGRNVRRLQFSCDVNHAEAVRWAQLLGFSMEACMRGFGHDGADHLLFSRVKDS